ncbi:DUF6924 domain-containing protein [Streptomyces coerulescens]|uniref:DUF6924 domain-containing protein n=1 Tax=Streptomyces coerulescens TaxID=29304 RepID=A0ABW0CX52_STRCD
MVRLAEAGYAGDWVAFWDVALEAHAAGSGLRGSVWGEVLDAAQRMPREVREGVALPASARFQQLKDDVAAQRALLVLLAVISPGLPDDPLVPERRAILASAGRRFEADLDDATLAQAELAAGRELTAPAVAAIRRSSVLPHAPHSTVALGRELPEPVLNVGEPWAEQVLADLPGLGAGWTHLLRHALSSTSAATPPARWEKEGRALLDALSPQPCGTHDGAEISRRIISWLALVGRPRTIPLEPGIHREQFNEVVDPYNAPAVRGLVRLLTYLPPRPETAASLSTLTEVFLRGAGRVGPGDLKIANLCIRALSRMGDETASTEPARLAASVTHRGARKLLQSVVPCTVTAEMPPEREAPRSLPRTDDTLLIRTDLSDHAAWQTLHTAITTPGDDDFLANVHIVDDPAYRDLTTEQVVSLALAPAGAFLVIVADRIAVATPRDALARRPPALRGRTGGGV